ncbi:hypothetical protein ACHAWF_002142 [Thalassiosira exigua]
MKPRIPLWISIYSPLLLYVFFVKLDDGSRRVQVEAAGNDSPIPKSNTVRPISGRSQFHRRFPFISSRNSSSSAKEAYLRHVENELKSAQRQLYASQETCTTLRKRVEDQRTDVLELMAARSRDKSNVEGESLQETIQQQENHIEQLRGELQLEREQYEQQVERLDLLSAELKEVQLWKETEEGRNDEKALKYEGQLNESQEQIQMLTLKLEAAEFAAKQLRRSEGEAGESKWQGRTAELRSELESIRAKYSKVLVSSMQESNARGDEGGAQSQQRMKEDMDEVISSAIEVAFENLDREWGVRYKALEQQLSNMTDYVASLEGGRGAALARSQEELASSTTLQDEVPPEDSKLLKKQQKQMRKDLEAQLTESLTRELTEKLTKELTGTLSETIERKYEKKYKRLRRELEKRQQESSAEQQQHQSTIDEQIAGIKEQCEKEYQSKLQQLRAESEEQVESQKERMRKLVRALLDREARQKGESARAVKTKKKRKSADASTNGGRLVEKAGVEEIIPNLSSRKNRRTRPGVVPVRGGNR